MNKYKFINYKKIIIIVFLTFYNLFLFSQVAETPVVEYVTINPVSGKPIIKWKVNNTSLLSGYFIKRYIYSCTNYNKNWHTIATIHNSNQLIFEDNTTTCEAKPNERFEKYFVRSFHVVGNDTVMSSISDFHQTVFLEINYNYCEKANYLKWSKYIGWGSNLINYEVYYKNQIGNFVKIATNSYNDTTFIHQNVNNNQTYTYFIKAIKNNGITSNSNIQSVFTKSIKLPQFLKPDSIISDNKINLYFRIDENADTKRYVLYKSSSKNGVYDSILGYTQLNNNKISFSEVNNNKLNYYYVSAVDYCNDEIYKSEIVNNIFLEAKKKSDLDKTSMLKWYGIENEEYKIYRCNKPNNIFYEINTSYNLNYNDNINDIFANQFSVSDNNGEFCYRVINEKSNFVNKSNFACVKFNETVFVANAFNPKSSILENRTFKPKIAFVSDYELIVYGTFGDIIFKTTNPNVGWDGRLPNGKLAKRAAYLYYFSYINSSGKRIIKKDFVSLVY